MSQELLEFFRSVLVNSPLVAIILLILWQYRRDYSKIFEQSLITSKQLIEVITAVNSALQLNNIVTENNKRATEENTLILRKFVDQSQIKRNGR